MTTQTLPMLLLLSLSTLGFVGMQPDAEAACGVNVGGMCLGDCDVNAVGTCYAGGNCAVNALATCGDWAGGYASCFVNAGLATCDGGFCFTNAALADCSGSCFVNAGSAWCSGFCLVNAGAATCSGGCTVNVAANCDSYACVVGTAGYVEPICFLWGCTVNVGLSYCGSWATCTVNLASTCYGNCAVNVASPEILFSGASGGVASLWMGCGDSGNCLVNAAARCEGDCLVNAALARCDANAACDVNVFATCGAFRDVLS